MRTLLSQRGSCSCPHQRTSGVVPCRLPKTQHHRPAQRTLQPHAASRSSIRSSFDSEDELDNELARELTAVADPDKVAKMQKHFDLVCKVTKTKGSLKECSCCEGTGEKECGWCHGTGFMTVGDKIYTNQARSHCPVCKGKGYVPCEYCRGTGSVAHWITPDVNPRKPRPPADAANN